ncbi:V-set and immunoglobulin domain-containing protein 2 [Bufo gargarizans]|uniref:V-set and immunoglobulin domain-containing protein 2 n=1 Tax=Bufo gargarizans TaxID=30331 RepID=UPI001CF4BF74|nr:V-set and immunoglobulin domain-containing protein 2 [Bufo gargarizans]
MATGRPRWPPAYTTPCNCLADGIRGQTGSFGTQQDGQGPHLNLNYDGIGCVRKHKSLLSYSPNLEMTVSHPPVIMDSKGKVHKFTPDVAKAFCAFYEALYNLPPPNGTTPGDLSEATDKFLQTLNLPSISSSKASLLTRPISDSEIRKVLMSIPSGKSPGPDGFSIAIFYSSLGIHYYLSSGWVYSVTVTSPEKIVVGKSGSTVVLPCLYSTTVGNQFVVEWKFLAGNGQSSKWQQIYYFSDGKTYKPGSQADRLTAVQNPPTSGVASIQLTNIVWSDNGTYVCEVNNPPDFSGSGSGIMQLSVLVPPTYPTCQSNGNTITGQDATLTCSSTGNPSPIYSWSIVGAKTALLPGMMENEITGSLLLTNLSEPMSGTYRCTASNEMGQSTCQVTISVSSAGEAGVVAGAVVGVLLALIVIAAILFYLLFYRKKRKDAPKSDHPGNEIREDAVSPMMSDEQRRPRDSHYSRGSQDRSENRARVV